MICPIALSFVTTNEGEKREDSQCLKINKIVSFQHLRLKLHSFNILHMRHVNMSNGDFLVIFKLQESEKEKKLSWVTTYWQLASNVIRAYCLFWVSQPEHHLSDILAFDKRIHDPSRQSIRKFVLVVLMLLVGWRRDAPQPTILPSLSTTVFFHSWCITIFQTHLVVTPSASHLTNTKFWGQGKKKKKQTGKMSLFQFCRQQRGASLSPPKRVGFHAELNAAPPISSPHVWGLFSVDKTNCSRVGLQSVFL